MFEMSFNCKWRFCKCADLHIWISFRTTTKSPWVNTFNWHLFLFAAFKFCLQYTRKAEFRKLCDNLRMHLGQIQRHHNQSTAINLNNPDSQSMHLETRLVQLDSAISMELWQVCSWAPHHAWSAALPESAPHSCMQQSEERIRAKESSFNI